jgi:tetratricopeptide (TPR) repeat protein
MRTGATPRSRRIALSDGRYIRRGSHGRCHQGAVGRLGVIGWTLLLLPACTVSLSEPVRIAASTSLRAAMQWPASTTVIVPAGIAVRVRSHSASIDVRLEVRDGEATAWQTADAPGLRGGTDVVLLEAGAERTIEVRLRSVDEAVAAGDVSITVDGLPIRGHRDQMRIDATRREAQACARVAARNPAADELVELLASARNDYERAGSRTDDARATYHEAAARYYFADDWQGTAAAAAAAASKASRLRLDESVAQAIALEGAAWIEAAGNLPQGETARAPSLLDRARLRLADAAGRFERQGLTYQQAFAINYRGVAFHYQGRWDEADEEYARAGSLFAQAGSLRAVAMALQNQALLAYERGDFPQAIARFDRALEMHSQAGQQVAYAHALHNSALAAQAIGNFDEAISRFHRAATILRDAGDAAGEARALHGLGITFKVAGDNERARALLEQAAPLRKSANDRRGLLTTLIAIGDLDREDGSLREAVDLHREALSLATAPQERSAALLAVGRDQVASGQRAEALRTFDTVIALPLPATYPGLGSAYLERAVLKSEDAGYAAALEDFERALSIHTRNGADVATADVLRRRAEARLAAGMLVESVDDADRALQLLERTGLQGIHADLRAQFLGARRDAYEVRIAALLQRAAAAGAAGRQGRSRWYRLLAFATSERSRAHQLLDAIDRRDTTLQSDTRRTERARLYGQLIGKVARRDALLEQPGHDDKVVAQLGRDIELLRAEIETVAVDRDASALDPGAAADLFETGSWEAPDGIEVAEYFVGSHKAWLFLARGRELSVREIPVPMILDRWVRAQFAQWKSPDSDAVWPPRDDVARALLAPLVVPAGTSSLWVAPDGPLHLLPIALYSEAAAGYIERRRKRESPEVVIIPSVQVLERTRAVSAAPQPQELLAVVADPVFAASDRRLASLDRRPMPADAAPSLSLVRGSERIKSLTRLPATAAEADALRRLTRGTKTLFLTGLDANRDAVLSAPLADFRILHFATHAFSNLSDPALSMLVLSEVDPQGQAREGALRAYDIATMKLNADLVVLSGCETAIGKRVSGEGLLGLSHAFLLAGARTVVASLWPVPDTATAILMQEFYSQLLTKGATPALALQSAELKVARQKKWTAPYYWAGFQVTEISPQRSERASRRPLSDARP